MYKIFFVLCYNDAFIVFDAEVVHDEFPSLGCVVAHIEAEDTFYVEILVQEHGVEPDIFAYEVLELVGRDFTKTFEACDFGIGGVFDGVDAFFVGIAVVCFLLVAHAEQRCLEDVDVSCAYELGVEAEEEGYQQQADVQAVDIGIGGNHDVVVAKVLDGFVDVEGVVEKVELDVFVYVGFVDFHNVASFSSQREDCLRLHVAAFGYGS